MGHIRRLLLRQRRRRRRPSVYASTGSPYRSLVRFASGKNGRVSMTMIYCCQHSTWLTNLVPSRHRVSDREHQMGFPNESILMENPTQSRNDPVNVARCASWLALSDRTVIVTIVRRGAFRSSRVRSVLGNNGRKPQNMGQVALVQKGRVG